MIGISRYIQERPLVIFQIAGWAIYVLADYLDHVYVGNYDIMPTLICGVGGYVMTGFAALLFDWMAKAMPVLRWGVFFAFLYGSIVIWHKLLIIFHNETSVATEFQKVIASGIKDWIATGFMPAFLFIAWAAFFFLARQYMARQKEQVLLQRSQLETKRAQLQTLRHQLNPHFLFNILNSIDVSVQSDDKDTAHKMTQHLSKFLRSSLERGEVDKIPFGQELEMLREFVSIEELRFKDKLRVNFNVPAEVMAAQVPAMLFQPLIENAVKFAWSQRDEGFVDLTAEKVGHSLCVKLSNSKANISSPEGTGTGLKNTRDRLAILYGEDASLEIYDGEGQFTLTVTLPFEVAL